MFHRLYSLPISDRPHFLVNKQTHILKSLGYNTHGVEYWLPQGAGPHSIFSHESDDVYVFFSYCLGVLSPPSHCGCWGIGTCWAYGIVLWMNWINLGLCNKNQAFHLVFWWKRLCGCGWVWVGGWGGGGRCVSACVCVHKINMETVGSFELLLL